MRFVLLVLVVLLVVWAWRAARRRIDVPKAPVTPSAPPAEPEEMMLSCMHCGLHLPRGEALPGRGGVFCGETHRTEYEKSHPLQ